MEATASQHDKQADQLQKEREGRGQTSKSLAKVTATFHTH